MIRRDSILHFETSALLVVLCSVILPVLPSGVIAFAAGVAKELHDRRGHGVASWHDIIADALGVALGVIVVVLTN